MGNRLQGVKGHSSALSFLQGRKQNSWLAGTCSAAGLANVLWFLLLLRQGTDQRAAENVGLLSPLGGVHVVCPPLDDVGAK